MVVLLFNYAQLSVWHRSLIPDAILWLFGSWLPSLGKEHVDATHRDLGC